MRIAVIGMGKVGTVLGNGCGRQGQAGLPAIRRKEGAACQGVGDCAPWTKSGQTCRQSRRNRTCASWQYVLGTVPAIEESVRRLTAAGPRGSGRRVPS